MIRYLFEITTLDSEVIRVSSSCPNPRNPSDIRYSDGLGSRIAYPVRLDGPPSITHKISDSISGTTILNQFSISLINDDGLYDNLDSQKIFGASTVLYRSDKENPLISDFDVISVGTVAYPIISDKKVTLYINSTYRALTDEVCRVFSTDDYPNLPDSNVDKKIPVGYGPGLNNVPLFQIDSTDLTKYIILDPDYLTAVDAVYDSDGNSISFTGPDVNGIITATDASSADVQGLLNNTIGEMIIYELEQKSGITYNSDNWDLTESGIYRDTSATLNFYFTGGNVRSFVDAVLKSDNAFLFTKNNGKLTMRQWGTIYNIYSIPSWMITQFDKKDYKYANKYFNSSVEIKYDKNQGSGQYENQYIDATEESAIELLYGSKERKTYKTDLYQFTQVQDLASRLVNRFGEMSPNCKVGVGVSTASVNLLDIIELSVNINGREYSSSNYWVVRQCNPAQDVLYLEALSGYTAPNAIDGFLSMPLTEELGSANLSQPKTEDIDGNKSQPISVIT